jgi:hypothetical protein
MELRKLTQCDLKWAAAIGCRCLLLSPKDNRRSMPERQRCRSVESSLFPFVAFCSLSAASLADEPTRYLTFQIFTGSYMCPAPCIRRYRRSQMMFARSSLIHTIRSVPRKQMVGGLDLLLDPVPLTIPTGRFVNGSLRDATLPCRQASLSAFTSTIPCFGSALQSSTRPLIWQGRSNPGPRTPVGLVIETGLDSASAMHQQRCREAGY